MQNFNLTESPDVLDTLESLDLIDHASDDDVFTESLDTFSLTVIDYAMM
jgi:hypothetical protein